MRQPSCFEHRGNADRLIYRVQRSGFLKHRVNVVGVLLEAGRKCDAGGTCYGGRPGDSSETD